MSESNNSPVPTGAQVGSPDGWLRMKGITAGYGSTVVLRSVDLDVPAGAVVALLGPNGAGKTTLLRTASGLVRPVSGSVYLGSMDLTKAAPFVRARAGLCLIPEGRGIYPNLTVEENLKLHLLPGSSSVDEAFEYAQELFPILGDRRRQLAGSMSGGQQQMLALSRAYITQPRIVLLDEVSMGLAPRAIDEIFAALNRLAKTGVSILLVEQYISRALEIADRVVLLDKGVVSFSGAPRDLDNQSVLSSYLGDDLRGGIAG